MSFSDEEVKAFLKNPVIYDVSRDQITLTLPFKQAIYDEWLKDPLAYTVRRMLREKGINPDKLPKLFYRNLTYTFKRCGRPKREKPLKNSLKSVFSTMPVREKPFEQEDLIATGKFIRCERGIDFSPEYAQELYKTYPEKPLLNAIRDSGIDPDLVGYGLIHRLERQFIRAAETGIKPYSSRVTGHYLSEQKLDELRRNPYVRVANTHCVELSDSFYASAASLASLPVDDILKVYSIEGGCLTITEKVRVLKRLRESGPPELPAEESAAAGTVFEAAVLKRKEAALAGIVDKGFAGLAERYPSLPAYRKKDVCLWIEGLPKDPAMRYTKQKVIRLIGITRSVYYLYVRKEGYGLSRHQADLKVREAVREAFAYKGYRKGSRLVCMLLPRITGIKAGLKRVRRIMKEEGLSSGVRGANLAKQGAAAFAEGAVKPNLLKRRFRLYRPNRVRVTDVTVLNYGAVNEEGKKNKAYGSALMDPVTGKLLAFVVSENNDLELALETLRKADRFPCEDGGIFHSDQGGLYKAKEFQKKVLERGLNQSMSKKGNCWDNATQESFFGHFKDECSYGDCKDIDELKKTVEDFADYYNNERGMWDRGRMTPVEYEKYLLSLDEEGFRKYLEQEEEKYNAMKEHAALLAKKRYGTLGV